MPSSMQGVRSYRSECETLDVAAFCKRHPCPFLVHSTLRQRALLPRSLPANPTFDHLVIEKGSLNSDRVMPLEDGYQAVALPLPKNADRRISLGRAEDCDVVINDVSVSRVHAYLEHDGTAWSIVDGGSTAGTQLNDRLIPSGEPRKLAPLDRISVGYVSLVFTPASDFHGFVRSLFGL